MIPKKYKVPSVLTIAGLDSSGGAGQQADIKTISSLGCYATCALTALPVQNTLGVRSIFPINEEAIDEQISVVLDDIYPDAIKIGMVHTASLALVIAKHLRFNATIPVVLDPVMVATSGHRLIEEDTIQTIIRELFPLVSVITPNMDEAAVLAGVPVKTLDDMRNAGEIIMSLGCQSLLLKGGHQTTRELTSLYFRKDGTVTEFVYEKFETNNTHGSGCTLSSAIASYIAMGHGLADAVRLGQDYVHQAIREGAELQIGKGNGPLNHLFNPQKMIKYEME